MALRLHSPFFVQSQEQAQAIGAANVAVAFNRKDNGTARGRLDELRRRFCEHAASALGSGESAEIFNSAADFASALGVSWHDMGTVLGELLRHRKIPMSVIHAWHHEGREAIGEQCDPAAKDAVANIALEEHGVAAEWDHAQLLRFIYRWFRELNGHFFDGRLPQPAISVDWNRITTLGTYRIGRDGLGLLYRININIRHLHRPRALMLAVLVHEMLHEWEDVCEGRKRGGGYHTKRFQNRAEEIGIPTNSEGHYSGINPQGAFARLLERHGIRLDEPGVKLSGGPPPQPRSSLQKWSCGCTNIWASRGTEVNGLCRSCDQQWTRHV